MGILLFMVGIVAIISAIGFAILYFAVMVALFAFVAAWLFSFPALQALLGDENALWAALVAFPLGILGLLGAGKLVDK